MDGIVSGDDDESSGMEMDGLSTDNRARFPEGSCDSTLEAFHHVFSKNIEIKDTLFLQKQVLKTF